MLLQWVSCLWLTLLMGSSHVESANGKLHSSVHWHRNFRSLKYVAILVDQSGNGNFTSVQSAIDSIPSNNKRWFCIYIKGGIYREKVKIPYDKPYIILKGEGKRKTQIVWGDYFSTAQSPTFTSLADNTVAKSISFVNSHNFLNKNNPVVPAVAAMISGDRSAFYRCNFAGVQDTLWDDNGRHYFKECTIQGAVDFIFGSGQSLYEGCIIKVVGGGFITAQGRNNPKDTNGFVFKDCKIVGKAPATSPVYLGRPWREYSRVIFYKCYFSKIIDPKGWNPWHFVGEEDRTTYAEYGNYGPGAVSKQRVSWVKKLGSKDIDGLTSLSFINSGNWIQRQPV
ncbi:hypothetical protein MANES_03G148200v8 [Manihot esculenta]|uniref:Uncharacterized protein n=2 Tax=Manihot esculenta TaxID=3983 RepID=A0ACB7I5U0_MANES|nr:hypothetical protein MANES_03G148200v8 [Manihot esculenta]